MLLHVLASFLQRHQIFFGVGLMKWFSRCNVGAAAMHFQSTSCCNNDSGVRCEPTDTAFNVTELFHAHVSSETAFCQNISDSI